MEHDPADRTQQSFYGLKLGREICLIDIKYPKELTKLNARYNQIPGISRDLISNLRLLEIIYFGDNKIHAIQEKTFSGCMALKELSLSNNGINSIGNNAFQGCVGLKILSLDQNNLSVIDRQLLKDCSSLQELYLDKNQLQEMEADLFSECPQLRKIKLDDNRIESIDPVLFENNENLEEVYFNRNLLQKVDPIMFKKTKQIKKIGFSDNKIERIEDFTFADLSFLTHVFLYGNSIHTVAKSAFKGCKSLQDVLLANNELSHLDPEIFKDCIELSKVNLFLNKLSAIDDQMIISMNKLAQLYLACNKINTLSKELIFSSSEYLTTLGFSSNQLRELPDEIFKNCKNLTALYLDNNQICNIKSTFLSGCTKLRSLFLNNNNLTTFSTTTLKGTSIVELKLSDNQIANIEGTFSEYDLNLIDLGQNLLKQLNDTFINVESLEQLILSNNCIKHIKDNSFQGCTALKKICLNGNLIKVLTKDIFESCNSLVEIDLNNNQLLAIAGPVDGSWSSISYLTQLEKLYLFFNHLEYFNFKLDSYHNLRELYLFKNQIKKIEIDFKDFPVLEDLNISSCKLHEINFQNRDLALKLERLYLMNCSLDNNKIKDIDSGSYKFGNFPKLQTLDLSYNLISEFSLEKFEEQFPSLSQLYLYENRFEKKMRDELRAKCKCNLEFDSFSKLDDDGYYKCLSQNSKSFTAIPQFKKLRWDPIPMLSILTGTNGVGKTSLLNCILNDIHDIKENSDDYDAISVLFLRMHDRIVVVKHEDHYSWIANINKRRTNKNKRKKGSEDSLPSQAERERLSIKQLDSVENTIIFLKNHLNELNEHLSSAKFNYHKIELDGPNAKSAKEIFLSKTIDGRYIRVALKNLSPGEHLILLILLWQYVFKFFRPKGSTVLLFDEPDSHLHPTAINQFMNSITKLVELGVQVIMTTHNATTVNFARKENLFLLESKNNETQPIGNTKAKNQIISALTSDLVLVDSPYRIVLVEGKDSDFYRKIERSVNSNNITSYQIMFSSSPSTNPGNSNKDHTRNMIKMMRYSQIPLMSSDPTCEVTKKLETFYAIVDTDRENRVQQEEYTNLLCLERYSKENYVLDPFNLLLLFERSKNNQVETAFKRMEPLFPDHENNQEVLDFFLSPFKASTNLNIEEKLQGLVQKFSDRIIELFQIKKNTKSDDSYVKFFLAYFKSDRDKGLEYISNNFICDIKETHTNLKSKIDIKELEPDLKHKLYELVDFFCDLWRVDFSKITDRQRDRIKKSDLNEILGLLEKSRVDFNLDECDKILVERISGLSDSALADFLKKQYSSAHAGYRTKTFVDSFNNNVDPKMRVQYEVLKEFLKVDNFKKGDKTKFKDIINQYKGLLSQDLMDQIEKSLTPNLKYSWFGGYKIKYPYIVLNWRGHDLDTFLSLLLDIDSRSLSEDIIQEFKNDANTEFIIPNELKYIINRISENDESGLIVEIPRKKEEKLNQIASPHLAKCQFVKYYTQWCPDCLELVSKRAEKYVECTYCAEKPNFIRPYILVHNYVFLPSLKNWKLDENESPSGKYLGFVRAVKKEHPETDRCYNSTIFCTRDKSTCDSDDIWQWIEEKRDLK